MNSKIKTNNSLPNIDHYLISMPDGYVLSLPIPEGDDVNAHIKEFRAHWKKVSKENPNFFQHHKSKVKCPKCSGDIYYKVNKSSIYYWCADCEFERIIDSTSMKK